MTFEAWVTDLSLGIMLLAVGIGVLARIPREVLVASWMRACGWKPETECRTGGAESQAVPDRGEAAPGRCASAKTTAARCFRDETRGVMLAP